MSSMASPSPAASTPNSPHSNSSAPPPLINTTATTTATPQIRVTPTTERPWERSPSPTTWQTTLTRTILASWSRWARWNLKCPTRRDWSWATSWRRWWARWATTCTRAGHRRRAAGRGQLTGEAGTAATRDAARQSWSTCSPQWILVSWFFTLYLE